MHRVGRAREAHAHHPSTPPVQQAAFRITYDSLYSGSATPEERRRTLYNANDPRVKLEGALMKQEHGLLGSAKWVRKWVVCTDTHLSYYATADRPTDGDAPRKHIPLSALMPPRDVPGPPPKEDDG